jgi:hypothetical protein
MIPLGLATDPHDTSTIDGVYSPHIARVFWLLREKLPRVLEANRYFEEQTGFHNEAGRNNLVDALSHLATLIEQAGSLSFEAQGEQVALLEDHLRRSMMEAFEQVLKLRLGVLAELWDTYEAVDPASSKDAPIALLTADDVDRTRRRIALLLERGRETKRETSWEAWEAGTQHLVDACQASADLEVQMRRGLAYAERARAKLRAGVYLTAVLALITVLALGVAIGSLLSS